MILIVEFTGELRRELVELAQSLGSEVEFVQPEPSLEIPFHRLAALLVSCAGEEWQAVEWLSMQDEGDASALLVVGKDPGRRLALEFVDRGATDYFVFPEDAELLQNALAAAVARFSERGRTLGAGEPDSGVFRRIVGESPAMKRVLLQAERLLGHRSGTALILGETGTGKELLARAIHAGSPRCNAPFVPVNRSALPAQLIESELFGHGRGAFTHAYATKPGLFEVADGGTLFLDEIATLPLSLQAKLLRVLEDMEVR